MAAGIVDAEGRLSMNISLGLFHPGRWVAHQLCNNQFCVEEWRGKGKVNVGCSASEEGL